MLSSFSSSQSAIARRFFVVLCAAGALGAAGIAAAREFKVGAITVDHPHAMPTVQGMVNGGVFINAIKNAGDAPDRLVSASSPVTGHTELHTMVMDGNVMRMHQIPAIDVPAKGEVQMRRGQGQGLHVMLMGLKKPLVVGDTFPLTLTFERAGSVDVQVLVQKPMAAAADAAHKHH